MPMRVQYSLPGLVPEPSPLTGPSQARETPFQARLRAARAPEVIDWRRLLRLDTAPAGARHIGPPPPPAGAEPRDHVAQREHWRRMLSNRLRDLHSTSGRHFEAAPVERMMSLLVAMQQAADSIVARHLSEQQQ